ncbi:hypothetical protein DPMN_111098 [Dreissena polymorpha]|uniref:Uncharacterized protein n=1 Tax=Dreissena polymorpha TaxID=45954 RepID=A0A9D4KD80_DREPO|nr:hypothetical protein DPMN_111098 [Dreissena polymorpha]
MDTKKARLLLMHKVLFFLVQHNLPHTTLFKPLVDLCVELSATNLSFLNKAKNTQYTSLRIVGQFLQCPLGRRSQSGTKKRGVLIDGG